MRTESQNQNWKLEHALCYIRNIKGEEVDKRVISHKVNCTHLLESTVCEGVEKEGNGEAGHVFVAC